MNSFLYLDIINKIKFGFQDVASPIVEGIHDLHDHIMFFIVMICCTVFFMLFDALYGAYPVKAWQSNLFATEAEYLAARKINVPHWVLKTSLGRRIVHDNLLETLWTMAPSIILLSIGAVSFILLYCMDEPVDPAMTIKINGNQWYWNYEYRVFVDTITYYGICNVENTAQEFFSLAQALRDNGIDVTMFGVKELAFVSGDSYLTPEANLTEGQLRLLETDRILVIPAETHIKLLVTASDVIHAWALPSFGIKIDAVPGRLNQVFLYAKRTGMFYGQCSEICGVGHGFMPIQVMAIPAETFFEWLFGVKGAKLAR
jgi:cytochrome c oxidase subunit 2